MGVDEDTQASEDEGESSYRVGPNAPRRGSARAGETVAFKLEHIIARLAGDAPLGVRAVAVGAASFVSCEVFAEDAIRVGHLLRLVAQAGDADSPVLSGVPVCAGVAPMDVGELDPTWYSVRRDVEYMGGLETAFHARAMLRVALFECLPCGPLAVTPTARLDGRGVVRFKVTVPDAERLQLLLCYVGSQLQRGGDRA